MVWLEYERYKRWWQILTVDEILYWPRKNWKYIYIYICVFCLFVWVFCHINLCRLFNAISIFIQIVLLQTFIYEGVFYLCFSIVCVGVGPEFSPFYFFFLNLVLRHVNLFSSVKSVWCSLFLFDELCKLNLLFTFLPIRAFMSPPMTRTLCFGMLQTREDSSL